MKFQDIPQYSHFSNYSTPWRFVANWLQEMSSVGPDFLQVDSDFQRPHVWTELQQRRYVEYVLRGGVAARTIYWNCPNWQSLRNSGPMTLVDGKQRLEAVQRFLQNQLTVFEGYRLTDFEDRVPLDCSFLMAVNDLPDRASTLQWYLDLNSGGTVHSDEELIRVRTLLDEALIKKTEVRS